MDIASWLAELGLAKYAGVFAENEISLDALPHLIDGDLKDIGLPLGPRKVVMAAIGRLSQDTPAKAQAKNDAQPVSGAERRQLTVMFVDLVGSTALSARLDPEEMGTLIRQYQNAVAGEIARLDGHVAKFMGDGVLAYFGWPRAHENEAERAARAGLAVRDATRALRTPDGAALAARIGIATGLVVVGDLVGEGSAREESATGDTLNLAARLQTLAETDQIVIADSTRRLLGNLFDIDSLGRHALKGLEELIDVYAVVGERLSESRYAAQRDGALTPIVGREQELGLLVERWGQACNGEGQLVLLTGEAGIGKSRSTEALIDSLRASDHTTVRYQCSPYHTDSALYPAIQHMNLAAGFARCDDGSARLDKLETMLAMGTGNVAAQAPLFAQLLGLDGDVRYGDLGLEPQQQRTRTLRALIDQISGLSHKRPLLFVIEDAHWIDPTTLELLELALDTVAQSRVLTLVTARPTFEHRFGGHPAVTHLMLNRLGRAQVSAIATRVSGGKALPDAVLDEIAARTDGVPLFVEEIAKTVLESGILREEDDGYVLTGPLTSLAIPATLHDSLMARLDRLRPVKEVAQTAAVIGRAFDYRTLAAIAGLNDETLVEALDRLVEAELVFRRGTPPDANYLFKHALVRDAAYESLLRSRRQTIHAALFGTLEEHGEAQPEILAHHAQEAGLTDRAIHYWTRAGEDALSRPAYREAVSHLESALCMIRNEAATPADRERELRLLISLGQALIAARGFSEDATASTFARATRLAEELGNQLGDRSLHLAAIYGEWANRYMRSIEDPEMAERLLALAEDAGDRGARLVALRTVALSRFHAGRYRETLELTDEILANYDPVADRDLALRYSHDARAAALAYRSWSLFHLGYFDQASQTSEAALAWATERNHGNTTGYTLSLGGMMFSVYLRRVPETIAAARRTLVLANDLNTPLWRSFARACLGWGLAQQGSLEEGLAELDAGLSELLSSNALRYSSLFFGLKAESHLLAGQQDAADAALAQAFAYLSETGDLSGAAELHRLAGWFAMTRRSPDNDAARASFERSLDIARSQGSKAIELRATTGMARLLNEQGCRDDARTLLAPVYGWFNEGFGMPDLQDARALMDVLA